MFEVDYGKLAKEVGDRPIPTEQIVAQADAILTEAGIAKKIAPTKAEQLAARTKGALEEGVDAEEALGREIAALPRGETPHVSADLYNRLTLGEAKTATYQELKDVRSRTRGVIRGLKERGELDAARRLQPLEEVYTDALESVLTSGQKAQLKTLDELYASEFIPKFGFESPASKLTEAASSDVITKLFPTKGKGEGVEIPSLTKAAVGAPEWERLSSTFWQQEILTPSIKGASIDFKEVQKQMARYKPETLMEAAGYKEFKTVIDKFSEAEQLTAKQIAAWQLKAGVKTEVARGRFATLEKALAGKQAEVTRLGAEAKSAEESLKFAQKSFEELTKNSNGLTHAVLRDFTGKARWVGAAGILYPAMRTALTMPQFVTGVGIMFTGEQLYRLLGNPAGRSSLMKLVRLTGDTANTVVEAQKIGVIYRGLVGNAPPEKGQP